MDVHTLKEKAGPLPVWGWGVLLGVAVIGYMYWSNSRANSIAASAAPTDPSVSSAAIDPSTGLPASTGTVADSGSLTDAWGNSVDTRLSEASANDIRLQNRLDKQRQSINKEHAQIVRLQREDKRERVHSGAHAKNRHPSKKKAPHVSTG